MKRISATPWRCWIAVVSSLVLGCSGESAAGGGGTGGAEPTEQPAGTVLPGLGFVASSFGFYYPSELEVAALDGFDLDGRASTRVEPAAGECPHDDFMSPDGQPHVDYNFLRIINNDEIREDGKFVFGGFREGQLVDGVINGATKNGSMTILLQVLGLDDLQNDDDVRIQIFASEDSPALGTDNSVLAGATLSVHPESRFHSGEVRGSVVDGVLTAGPIDLLFPIDIMIVRDEFLIHDSWLRLRVGDRSFEGTVSGYWDVDNLRRIIGVPTTDNGNAANFTIEEFDRAMIDFADGDYDEETGLCTSLTTMFQLRGIQAFLVADAGPTGAGGAGGSDGGGGGGPVVVDQCVNDDDQAAVEALATETQSGPAVVGQIAGECPTSSCLSELGAVLSNSGEAARNALGDCIAQCISDQTGLSAQCTACYGSIAACSTAFCVAPCVEDPASQECAECALENCIDVNACTGFY